MGEREERKDGSLKRIKVIRAGGRRGNAASLKRINVIRIGGRRGMMPL